MSPENSFHDDKEPGHERWLVSYADFITLMFAFFAVLYATSQHDAEKSKKFEESLKRFLIKAGAFGEAGNQIKQGEKNETAIESPIATFQNQKLETVQALDQTESFVESKFTEAEKKKYISDISVDAWGVRITLNSEALFSVDTEKFKPDAVSFVQRLGELSPQVKRRVLIEGHTRTNETGRYPSTWDFSSARAVNMLRFLEKTIRIPASQMAAAAFGDSRPVFKGKMEHLNSRIEVVLLNPDMEF